MQSCAKYILLCQECLLPAGSTGTHSFQLPGASSLRKRRTILALASLKETGQAGGPAGPAVLQLVLARNPVLRDACVAALGWPPTFSKARG